MSKPYTLDELLAIAVAREIHDYENVVLGVGVPMTAGALAKALFPLGSLRKTDIRAWLADEWPRLIRGLKAGARSWCRY